jgi:hypothetical protein
MPGGLFNRQDKRVIVGEWTCIESYQQELSMTRKTGALSSGIGLSLTSSIFAECQSSTYSRCKTREIGNRMVMLHGQHRMPLLCLPASCVLLLAEGLSERTSWQDLKDFGREAGPVAYADVFRDRGKIQG